MKFVVFGPYRRLGVVQGDRILDLERAEKDPMFRSLLDLIEAGDRGLDLVRATIRKFHASDEPGMHVELAQTRLHAPFPGMRFALAGSNFAQHIADGFTNRGKPITAAEVYAKTRAGKAGGFWVVNKPMGSGDDIPIPRSAMGLFDFEGEVAVVLGKGGKRVMAQDWTERIWGTTLVIDWSIRSQDAIQNRQPFYSHKIFDGCKSMGPCVVVDDGDPANCNVESRVNGELRQRFNTRDMIHSFGEIFEQISEDLTLMPGDVLAGGTGPGTAGDQSKAGHDGRLPLDLFLRPGDTVEVTSPTVGTLSARIVSGN